MKNINRLMKTMRWIFTLLIGMIGFAGFSTPSADLIQNSQDDSLELSELVSTIEITAVGHDFEVVKISDIDIGVLHEDGVIHLYSYEGSAFIDEVKPPLLGDVIQHEMVIRHIDLPNRTYYEIKATMKKAAEALNRKPRDGLISA